MILPEYLSHSSTGALAQCGELFRLSRIERVPRRPSWAAVAGTAFHHATEVWDRAQFGMSDPGLPGPDFNDWLDFEVVEHSVTYPPSEWIVTGRRLKATPNREDQAFWRANGPLWLESYKRWRHTASWEIWIDPNGEPAIEVELNFDLGGTPVRGYVDRVVIDERGSLGVLDIKSGAHLPTSPRQLALYSLGLERVFGSDCLPEWGCYYMARSATIAMPHLLTPWHDGRLRHEYETAWAMVRAGLFLPHESGLCRTCDVRDHCYVVGGADAEERKPYERDA